MSESEVRSSIVRQIKAWGGDAHPIETSSTSVGVPDINYQLLDAHEWIEVKVADFRRLKLTLRKDQVTWFERRIKAGGYPFIVAYVDGKPAEWMVFPGSLARELSVSTSTLYWRTRARLLHAGKTRVDKWAKFEPYFRDPKLLYSAPCWNDNQSVRATHKYGSKVL
jgi:hypothetical protein